MRFASRPEETRKHPMAALKASSHPLNTDLQILGNSYHFSWHFSKAALQNQPYFLPPCDHRAPAVVGQSSLLHRAVRTAVAPCHHHHCLRIYKSASFPICCFRSGLKLQSRSGGSFPHAAASPSRLWAAEKETWPFPKTSLQGLITSTPGTQETRTLALHLRGAKTRRPAVTVTINTLFKVQQKHP
ncbi:uncharacterized protein LJ206_010227 isoform 1-T1 [Theristicus caerulescens]